jgi:hypothetical protein
MNSNTADEPFGRKKLTDYYTPEGSLTGGADSTDTFGDKSGIFFPYRTCDGFITL